MGRNIEQVAYCGYVFDTWDDCPGYFDPENKHRSRIKDLPSQLLNKTLTSPDRIATEHLNKIDLLHVCRYCFKYTVDPLDLVNHETYFCDFRKTLPGKLVYKSNDYCIYQIDGNSEKMFCQCLCLFGKLFLDSKSVMFAVNGFDFYVLTERSGGHNNHNNHHTQQQQQQHPHNNNTPKILGFFSKEKVSWDNNNLGCLLVFPPFQKRGLGQLLIAYSYQLSKQTTQTPGSPERPLSANGKASYYYYWLTTIAQTLSVWKRPSISIDDISRKAFIEQADVVEALRSIDAFTWTVDPPVSQKYSQQISLTKLYDWANSHNVSLEPLIDKKHCISN